jgi:hypothetical protein
VLVNLTVVAIGNADTIVPFADSFVRDGGFAGNNYGTDTDLSVQKSATTGNTREAYINFGYSGGYIRSATLRVFAGAVSTPPVPKLWVFSSGTNWSEATLTYTNKPSMIDPLGVNNVGTILPSHTWEEYDVSSYMIAEYRAGRRIFGFGFAETNTGSPLMQVKSRESGNPPNIVIVTNYPPVVYFTLPSSGTGAAAPASFGLSVYAWDLDGSITNVAIYTNGVFLASDAVAPYTNWWTGVASGTYSLTAVAEDDLGMAVTSAPIQLISFTNYPVAIDRDTNHVPDILEDVIFPSPVSFSGVPFVVTGVFEAEQFDAGGPGVGYSNVVSYPFNDYRVTPMRITNCNDIGGGFQLRLKSNEWTHYSFNVQVAGNYVVSVRARGTNGGQFRATLGYANSTASYQMNLTALSGTEWHDVTGTVNLPAGPNSIRLEGIVDGANGFAGDVNWISIYPAFPGAYIPTNSVLVGSGTYTPWIEGDSGKDFLTAQTNTITLQRAVNDILISGGGTVNIPAGTFYLAHHPYQDWTPELVFNGPQHTFAVRLVANAGGTTVGSNIRIAGTQQGGTNASTLIAQSRTVTMFLAAHAFDGANYLPSHAFYLPDAEGAFTNIVFEDLVLVGNPHSTTNATFDPGWWWNAGYNPLTNSFSLSNTNPAHGEVFTNEFTLYWQPETLDGRQFSGVGALLWIGSFGRTRNVLINNCDFINPPGYPVLIYQCTDVLIRSNRFRMVNAFNDSRIPTIGIMEAPNPNLEADGSRGAIWNYPPNITGIFGGGTNLVVMHNDFDGNPSLNGTTNVWIGSDGFVWWQSSGGNYYIGNNRVRNYALEGVALNSGPTGAAANVFETPMKTPSTTGFGIAPGLVGVSGSIGDNSFSIVGNAILGGRLGFGDSLSWSNYQVHFCGNYVSNSVPLPASQVIWPESDSFGRTLYVSRAQAVNASGLTSAGASRSAFIALNYLPVNASSFLLANDFQSISDTNCVFPGSSGLIKNSIIARSILSYGDAGHVSLNPDDSGELFLFHNIYLNSLGVPAAPVVLPPSANVLIQ